MTEPELPAGYTLGHPSADIEDQLLAIADVHNLATLGQSDDDIEFVREWLNSPATTPERDGWIVRDERSGLTVWSAHCAVSRDIGSS